MVSNGGLPRSLLTRFHRAYPGHTPDVVVRAPGRVNLLGGHVDIQDGYVINITINREIWLAAAYGAAELVQLHAADLDESAALSLRRLDERADIMGGELPRWARYPAGVAWALQRRGLALNGMDAVFLGDVLMGAGLSSSAAVEEVFAIAWQALEGWRLDSQELAFVGREAEREYMGLGTGIQDQFTCLHARRDHALWLDCRTLEHRHLAFPDSVRVVVCDTNTRRELVGTRYNGRAEDGHATVRTISLIDPEVKALRDVSYERLLEFEAVLTESQFRRSRHVVTENARVQEGAQALALGDVAAFGELMNRSYWSARNDYGSSSPALDAMWQAATEHPGCYGARYSGGGEAGAVVALVDANALADFIDQTGARYYEMAGRSGNLFAVEAVDSAGVFTS
ncbi:MAG: galactokinase [Chloroflexi bacterium]|nr:galactokinase [Chloroflexota bacterium]